MTGHVSEIIPSEEAASVFFSGHHVILAVLASVG